MLLYLGLRPKYNVIYIVLGPGALTLSNALFAEQIMLLVIEGRSPSITVIIIICAPDLGYNVIEGAALYNMCLYCLLRKQYKNLCAGDSGHLLLGPAALITLPIKGAWGPFYRGFYILG